MATKKPTRPAYDPLAAARASISAVMTENKDKRANTSVRFDDQECCIVFALESARFAVSQRPGKTGQAYFVAELSAVESDHPKLTPGRKTSFIRFLAQEVNQKEVGAFLRAVTDVPELSDDAMDVLLADDAAALKGTQVRFTMVEHYSEKHGKSFYNPVMEHVSMPDEAAAALADVLAAELEDEEG